MRTISRRDFLSTTSAGTSAALLGSGCAGQRKVPFLDRLGAQLYTVRNLLTERPRETLEAIHEIGYRDVEIQDALYPKLAPMLTELGLTATSYRIPTALITGNWEMWSEMMARFTGQPLVEQDLAEVIDTAAAAGFKYLAVSYLLPAERDSPEAVRRSAEQYNRAGEACTRAGLRLCHHNHAFEFAPLSDTTAFEILMAEFDPASVGLQLDVFWADIAGQDPAAILERFPSRIPTMHLKDKSAGAVDRFTELQTEPEAFTEIGAGTIDFDTVLSAAEASGVERYYVEQDQSPDPVESLRRSYRYLSELRPR